MAPAALKKIDTSGVLFFLGILLSVGTTISRKPVSAFIFVSLHTYLGALDSAGILRSLAEVIDQSIPDQSIVATLIGFASALIDNVPLVAATMGMYQISNTPMDSQLWQLIALCAGTGSISFIHANVVIDTSTLVS